MTIWIATGGRPSNGALALATLHGFKRSRSGKFIKYNDLVVNWGSGNLSFINQNNAKVLNKPQNVLLATNKLSSFNHLKDVKTVVWTTKQDEAQKWADDGNVVVCRTKLTGHSGDGILIVEKHQPVPAAPLYTKYVFKEKEFRVHVANGKVIDVQQKIRDPDREPTNWKVRSHDNGFIYARNSVSPDDNRDQLAVAAVAALGLDFGAVDLIVDKHGVYYFLEANTAPGLEGQTVEAYQKAFSTWA